jgi:hypothetical protein
MCCVVILTLMCPRNIALRPLPLPSFAVYRSTYLRHIPEVHNHALQPDLPAERDKRPYLKAEAPGMVLNVPYVSSPNSAAMHQESFCPPSIGSPTPWFPLS